jgi:hypothetical protein
MVTCSLMRQVRYAHEGTNCTRRVANRMRVIAVAIRRRREDSGVTQWALLMLPYKYQNSFIHVRLEQ